MLQKEVGNATAPPTAFTVDPCLDCLDSAAVEFSAEVPRRGIEQRIGVCITGLCMVQESGVDGYVRVESNRLEVGYEDRATGDFDVMQCSAQHLPRGVGCFVGPKHRHTPLSTQCVAL